MSDWWDAKGNGWRKVDYDCRTRRLRFLMVRRNDYIVFSTTYVLELGINHGADVVVCRMFLCICTHSRKIEKI